MHYPQRTEMLIQSGIFLRVLNLEMQLTELQEENAWLQQDIETKERELAQLCREIQHLRQTVIRKRHTRRPRH